MAKCNFEYYVLNYNHNSHKVEYFNIFQNIRVQEKTEKIVKKYLRSPKNFTYETFDHKTFSGFDALVKDLESTIRWQEWSRYEYEISVGEPFEDDCDRLEKWDCYLQTKPNMEMLAREVLYQYKKFKKNVDKSQ